MRFLTAVASLQLLLVLAYAAEEKQWSWGGQDDQAAAVPDETAEDFIADESSYVQQFDSTNDTHVEEVIDSILVSNRQGRNVDGFDEVYKDPDVKKALDSGNDAEARNIIKDRLCDLGLMMCEGKSYGPYRPPSVTPEELIYAQPVDIQPIGKPIPSIPVRGPPRAYGPPKPIPLAHGPPHKIGYKPPGYGPPGPYGLGNYASGSHNSFSSSYEGGGSSFLSKPPGPQFLSKPPGPVYNGPYIDSEPYEFDAPVKGSFIKDKQGFLGSSTSIKSEVVPLQQHIHHHYHHGEDGKGKQPAVIVNGGAGSGIVESHLHSSSSNYQSGGFSPVSTGFGASGSGYSGVKPVYEGTAPGYASGLYKGSSSNQAGVYNLGYASSNNNYNPANSFNSNQFNSNQFYKKELTTGGVNNNLGAVNSNVLGSGSYYANGNQYGNQFGYQQETGRAEIYDCICVPYEQCPSQDVIGRKDDLFLPIDPRNLKKDIDAIEEEKVVITHGNGTMTVVRVPKMVHNASIASDAIVANATEKKVAKREVNDKASDSANKANVEPRQSGSDDDGSRGLFGKKIQPTFGVSFGLPHHHGHGGYGGYPINPYGPNPLVNPYGSSIGGGGVNLGLVSVDPLLSVQVTKNDYGEKVIKPLVNLHVTPNGNLIHKIGSIFEQKKHLLFNKPFLHGGGGFGGGYGGYGHGGYPPHSVHSHYHYGPYRRPPYHGPPHHGPPHHGPPHHHYGPPRPYPPPHFHGVYRDAEDGDELFESTGPYNNDAGDIHTFGNSGGAFEFGRSVADTQGNNGYAQNYNTYSRVQNPTIPDQGDQNNVKFPSSRRRRDTSEHRENTTDTESIPRNAAKRQAYFGQQQQQQQQQQCGPRHVCCKRQLPYRPQVGQVNQNLIQNRGQCGQRHSHGINGRIKTPAYVDGDSEFGEYPWQVAILKKDPKESVYVCGGTLIDHLHIITAAHCVKSTNGFSLRVRLGEWDVNHDVEFYPYIERDIVSVHSHPKYYAGTLDNDIAILRMDHPVDWTKYPHISPACMPDKYTDFTGARCWTTGWGKDAFGDFGKYQNILKEVDVPVIGHHQCEAQLRNTRLGYQYQLNPGFICAGGEEGKDACKGDGGGPMVCERAGSWQLVGVVSWGIGCGQVNVPGVYVKVAYYLDWIAEVTRGF